MRPVKDERTPKVFAKPKGMEECEDLPCNYDMVRGLIWSYWRPTFRERFLILFGRDIRLTIAGRVMAPVCLDTERV